MKRQARAQGLETETLTAGEAAEGREQTPWLVLVYRIPSEPTRLRVGVWRKLKGLGAIYIQNAAAALPKSAHAERHLRGLRAEIGDLGGVAYLFECTVLGGLSSLLQAFNAARDDEYEEIIDRCEAFLRQVAKEYEAEHFTYAELEENEVDLVKLKGWLEKVHDRDSFGADRYQQALKALLRCEKSLEEYASRVFAEEADGPTEKS